VYDHVFEGDHARFRFAFKWTDPKTGEARSRAGMQAYRVGGLGMDRCSCAGAWDHPAANQVRLAPGAV